MRNQYDCQCGATFRTASAEARHRHNFPLLCRRPKPKPKKERVRCRCCQWTGYRVVATIITLYKPCPSCGGDTYRG